MNNAYWGGFTLQHQVTSLFVWSFFGDYVFAASNYTGSWHDSKHAASSGLHYQFLSEKTPSGFAVIGY